MMILPRNFSLDASSYASLTYADVSEKGNNAMKKSEMNLMALLSAIDNHMPMPKDYLANLGFDFLQEGPAVDEVTYYSSKIPLELSDGVIISEIEIREIIKLDKSRSFVVLQMPDSNVTLQELEKIFGSFSVYAIPTGRSMNESITYMKHTDKSKILVGCDQLQPSKVKGISFDALPTAEK